MQTFFRRFVQIVFGLQAIGFLPALPIAIYMVSTRGLHNPDMTPTGFYAATGALSAIGIVYAGAWWSLKQGLPSLRAWGLAGSVLNLLFSLPLLFVPHLSAMNLLWSLPVAGIAGMFLFLTPANAASETARKTKVSKTPRIPGDATSPATDLLFYGLGTVGTIGGEIWCINFLHDNGIWRPRGLAFYAEIIGLLLIATLVHEFGHAFGGWSVGMKLRHFAFGPFQWQIGDGTWKFDFDAGKIFGGGGSTGNVPGGQEHQAWHSLLMVLAGPMINIGTGVIALGLGLTLDPQSSLQWCGAMLMFGMFSLVMAGFNLLPFRTQRGGYSDGAFILQLLNGGAAADIYFAFAFVSSSLVTPMGPADYDMDLLERAATVARGAQRVRLHLLQFQHYLDSGEMEKARETFARVESAYNERPGDVPAGLLQSMVFGAAYVKKDAATARLYWESMVQSGKDAKKPIRRNADYWIAECALYYSERHFEAANMAWERGAVLANRLPAAGAYNFDRHKYVMMRAAIEEHMARFVMVEAMPQVAQPAWDAAF